MTVAAVELRHPEPVVAMAMSLDGRVVATADVQGTLRLFHPATGACQEREPAVKSTCAVTDVVVSADGGVVAVKYVGGHAWVVDTAVFSSAPGVLVPRGVTGMALSPDGRTVVTAGAPGLTIAETSTGAQRQIRHGHSLFSCVAFVPDGSTVVTWHRRLGVQGLRMVDVATGALGAGVDVAGLGYLPHTHMDIAVRPDGRVAAVLRGLEILEWDGRSTAVHRRLLAGPDAERGWPKSRLVPPIGAVVVPLRRDATAILDLDSGTIRTELPDRLRLLSATADGRTVATAARNTVDFRDGTSLEPVRPRGSA